MKLWSWIKRRFGFAKPAESDNLIVPQIWFVTGTRGPWMFTSKEDADAALKMAEDRIADFIAANVERELPSIAYWAEIRSEQEMRERDPDSIDHFVCCPQGHPTQALADDHALERRWEREKAMKTLACFNASRRHESHAPRINDPKHISTENPSKIV